MRNPKFKEEGLSEIRFFLRNIRAQIMSTWDSRQLYAVKKAWRGRYNSCSFQVQANPENIPQSMCMEYSTSDTY